MPSSLPTKPLAEANARLRGPSSSTTLSRSTSRLGRQQPRQTSYPLLQVPKPQTKSPKLLVRETNVLPRLLGIEDSAAYLGLSTWSVRDMVTGGELVPVQLVAAGKPLRRLLFDRDDLDSLVEAARKL